MGVIFFDRFGRRQKTGQVIVSKASNVGLDGAIYPQNVRLKGYEMGPNVRL
jgi:hypothetical protein